jgi:hypothetical protein
VLATFHFFLHNVIIKLSIPKRKVTWSILNVGILLNNVLWFNGPIILQKVETQSDENILVDVCQLGCVKV